MLVPGRDEGRSEATLGEMRRKTGNEKSRCYLADFSSLGGVRDGNTGPLGPRPSRRARQQRGRHRPQSAGRARTASS